MFYLDGFPEITRYDKILVGDSPQQQIKDSRTLESRGVAIYNEGVRLCLELNDAGTRDLMECMVVGSEESIDWAETQLDFIQRVLNGLPAKCGGRFDLCGQCGCIGAICRCEAA